MERPGWPAARAGLWASGLPVPRSALHQPSASPGLPGPSLSAGQQIRRCPAVCAHIAAPREPALPGFKPADLSPLLLPHPPPPTVVGIRIPTGNVAMPLSPMKVGKGIRQSGGRKGWTEEAMHREGACWMRASWEEGWCGLDVQPTRITLAAILGG